MGPALKRKVVLLTGTVALQEQLYSRDLPAVLSFMDNKPSVALLKVRGVVLFVLCGLVGLRAMLGRRACSARRRGIGEPFQCNSGLAHGEDRRCRAFAGDPAPRRATSSWRGSAPH